MKKLIIIIICLIIPTISLADKISIGDTNIYQNQELTNEYIRGVTLDKENMTLSLDCRNTIISPISVENIPSLTIESLNNCEVLSSNNISLNSINSNIIITSKKRIPFVFEGALSLESSNVIIEKGNIKISEIIIDENSSLDKLESATLTTSRIINHGIEVTIPDNVDNKLAWYFSKDTSYFSTSNYNYERVNNQYRLSTMTIICIILLLIIELLLIIKKEQIEREEKKTKKKPSKNKHKKSKKRK